MLPLTIDNSKVILDPTLFYYYSFSIYIFSESTYSKDSVYACRGFLDSRPAFTGLKFSDRRGECLGVKYAGKKRYS